ncbi:MAG TPA: protein phosphatase CheZ [Lysobacter sp.]
MTDAPAFEQALSQDRQAVIARLHAALWALEHDDVAGWRSNVDALIQWRSQPLVQGLAKLARELETALGNRGIASTGSLPEACARLEQVVIMSEESSHRTLDLIQECGTLLGTLPDAAAEEQAATVAAIRSRMSEMTAAQGYQDLTGQIIRRVVELVRAVHVGLGEVADAGATPLHLNNSRGFGPSVAGVDPAPATQDDANELLSSLGL